LNTFRRANITWRQQVGGSAIEASKTAGHSDVDMTAEYTFVNIERQNELTKAIQERLAGVSKGNLAQPLQKSSSPPRGVPATSRGQKPQLDEVSAASGLVQ
jgi:hypothetical protein